MKKTLPKAMPSLQSDEAAEKFVQTADLSKYDLSRFTPVKFEFEPKTAAINMRLPHTLFSAVKTRAKAEGMPYSRYIRRVLEEAVIRQ